MCVVIYTSIWQRPVTSGLTPRVRQSSGPFQSPWPSCPLPWLCPLSVGRGCLAAGLDRRAMAASCRASGSSEKSCVRPKSYV